MRKYLEGFTHIKRNNLFNTETVNIFCDASYKPNYNKASYGNIAIYQNSIIYEDIRWHQAEDETINSLELKGIRSAVTTAFFVQRVLSEKAGHPVMINYINIFSDSKYSIDCIKRYLFDNVKWIWDYERGMYVKKYNGEKVPNQDLIIEVSNLIMKFQATFPNVVFDLWWCPAHEKLTSNLKVKHAGHRFASINCKKPKNVKVEQGFVRYICDSNDVIDNKVARKSNMYRPNKTKITDPIKFYYGP